MTVFVLHSLHVDKFYALKQSFFSIHLSPGVPPGLIQGPLLFFVCERLFCLFLPFRIEYTPYCPANLKQQHANA